ncbi:MAG: DinB family protein [Candidatus Eisenbacteria bacterium]
MLLTTIRDLMAHMEWADSALWSVVPSTTAQEPDPRLKELLFHIHYTQLAFTNLWTGAPREPHTADEFATLAAIRDWARPVYPHIASYLEALTDERLQETLVMPWSRFYADRVGKPPAPTTIGETLLQGALHSIHHRAQVSARLREMGIDPPMIDFVAWVWGGRPTPRW